jgi:uncharacterized protein YegJ (DUF2314 family)
MKGFLQIPRIVLFAILLFSCGRTAHDVSRLPSPEIEIEQNDAEIERIADNARRAFPIFLRNLSRPEKGAGNFFIKYPLTAADGGMEQVWLSSIHFKNGLYYGILANTATRLDNMKKGGVITFEPDAITDWMYIQDGKIMGGRSIKYLLEKIPEEKRSADQRRVLRMFE